MPYFCWYWLPVQWHCSRATSTTSKVGVLLPCFVLSTVSKKPKYKVFPGPYFLVSSLIFSFRIFHFMLKLFICVSCFCTIFFHFSTFNNFILFEEKRVYLSFLNLIFAISQEHICKVHWFDVFCVHENHFHTYKWN